MAQEITDRELLELAAKACGAEIHGYRYGENGREPIYGMPIDTDEGFEYEPWDPMNDDGAALRLAARLRIDLDWQATHAFPEPAVEAYRRNTDGSGHYCASEPETDYRRAIIRAAAEIGRTMQ